MQRVTLGLALVTSAFVAACGASPRQTIVDESPTLGREGDPSPEPTFGPGQPPPAPQSCAKASAAAVKPPIDFVFSIDQSGSMSDEASSLQKNINGLATTLSASALDYRLVMIAAPTGYAAVCVPQPLAGPGCASNGTLFRSVPQHLESNDTLQYILSTFKATSPPLMWRDFLRPDALKVFVPITDDNAYGTTSGTFDTQLLAAGGTLFGDATKRKYVFYPIIGAAAFPSESTCGSGAVNNGSEYIALAKKTGGKWFPICAIDFAKVLTEIGKAVNAQVACELAIPKVDGQELDKERVNVKVTNADGTVTEVLQDNGACDGGADGWQYSADGKSIVLCGKACNDVKAQTNAKVNVEFGCATKVK